MYFNLAQNLQIGEIFNDRRNVSVLNLGDFDPFEMDYVAACHWSFHFRRWNVSDWLAGVFIRYMKISFGLNLGSR